MHIYHLDDKEISKPTSFSPSAYKHSANHVVIVPNLQAPTTKTKIPMLNT